MQAKNSPELKRAGFSHEFQEGKIKRIELLNGRHVAVVLWQGSFYAFEDQCPHRGAALSDGRFHEGKISCPWHAATFEVISGQCLGGPSKVPLHLHSPFLKETPLGTEVWVKEAPIRG